MNITDRITLAFHMDPVQHTAMSLEHPAVLRPLSCTLAGPEGPHGVFCYTGEPFQISRLLELVRDWKNRPATPEQLRDILGEDCA